MHPSDTDGRRGSDKSGATAPSAISQQCKITGPLPKHFGSLLAPRSQHFSLLQSSVSLFTGSSWRHKLALGVMSVAPEPSTISGRGQRSEHSSDAHRPAGCPRLLLFLFLPQNFFFTHSLTHLLENEILPAQIYASLTTAARYYSCSNLFGQICSPLSPHLLQHRTSRLHEITSKASFSS